MSFTVSPMFPGDLYDTTERMAATVTTVWSDHNKNNASTQWIQILELGWQGVLINEDAGGAGATLNEFSGIAEVAGRHALVLPLIARCVVAPLLLAKSTDEKITRLLEQVSFGQASVCPVIETNISQTVKVIETAEGQLQLKGVLLGADLTEPATHLVFNAITDQSSTPQLLILPTSALTKNVRYFTGLDGRRTADITMDGLTLAPEQVLFTGQTAIDILENSTATGALMTCVQTVGAIGAMIEQTIQYLTARTQFGVALSTFQALRHRVVEMYVAYESAHGLVKQVTEQFSSTLLSAQTRNREAALTKLYLASVGRMVAESTIQLHGGMGMTVEMPAARLAMHTLMCNLQFGDRLQHLDLLSAQMSADLKPSPPSA